MKKLLLLAVAIVPLALSAGPVHSAVFDNPGNINAVDVSQFNKTNAEINAMNAYDKYSYGLNMSIAGSRLSANNDGANEGTQSSAEYDAYDTGTAMDERGREIMNAAGGRAASGHGSSSFGGIASALTGGLAGGGDFDITSVLSGGIITDDGFNATSILSGGLLNEEQVGDLDIKSLLSAGVFSNDGFLDIENVLSGGVSSLFNDESGGFNDIMSGGGNFSSFTDNAMSKISSLDSEDAAELLKRMYEMQNASKNFNYGGTNSSSDTFGFLSDVAGKYSGEYGNVVEMGIDAYGTYTGQTGDMRTPGFGDGFSNYGGSDYNLNTIANVAQTVVGSNNNASSYINSGKEVLSGVQTVSQGGWSNIVSGVTSAGSQFGGGSTGSVISTGRSIFSGLGDMFGGDSNNTSGALTEELGTSVWQNPDGNSVSSSGTLSDFIF